jgi:hypothetical protein
MVIVTPMTTAGKQGDILNRWAAAGLAGLLAVGTLIGVVTALNDTSSDRVTPASTAPVYGNP